MVALKVVMLLRCRLSRLVGRVRTRCRFVAGLVIFILKRRVLKFRLRSRSVVGLVIRCLVLSVRRFRLMISRLLRRTSGLCRIVGRLILIGLLFGRLRRCSGRICRIGGRRCRIFSVMWRWFARWWFARMRGRLWVSTVSGRRLRNVWWRLSSCSFLVVGGRWRRGRWVVQGWFRRRCRRRNRCGLLRGFCGSRKRCRGLVRLWLCGARLCWWNGWLDRLVRLLWR